VFTIPSGPYRSTTPDEIQFVTEYAHSIGLSVILSPIIDPDWRNESNCRGTGCSADSFVSRLMLGKDFTSSQWQQFFTSYRAFLAPLLAAANSSATSRPEVISVAAELQAAALHADPKLWTDLCDWVRQQIPTASLTYAAITTTITGGGMRWIDALD